MSEPRILRKGHHESLTIDGAVAQATTIGRRDGPIGPAIDAARPREGADHGTVCSGDGLFQASIPLAVLRSASLAEGRLQVEDSPTRCWLVKDVVRIEVTRGRRPDSLPADERAKTR